MGVHLEMPRDALATQRHAFIPEFQTPIASRVLKAKESDCVDGEIEDSFASEGFTSCSALIFKSTFRNRFGFFHAYSWQEVDDEHQSPQVLSLRRLAGASAILLEGTQSVHNVRLLYELHTQFAIDVVRTIPVDTRRPMGEEGEGKFHPFHVVFRPWSNTILVARISHRDTLSYEGF